MQLFAALSEALSSHLRLVTTEKKQLVDEAKSIITTIRQMEASLDNSKARRTDCYEDEEIKITYPLNQCLKGLREKHSHISLLHKERFEQVKKLVEALESYSSHLEPTFVQIALPPTGPSQSLSPTFDISDSYVERLDAEFTRVYDEYTHRIHSVQALSNQIIQLWAELGTPQAQQDGAILKFYKEAPEQLGLHREDLERLHAKRDSLSEQKKSREKRLRDLKASVEALWLKLDIEEAETRAFLNQNRGCGLRQINEFEDELSRLNELKRQNLHLFVEDARLKLQELWDSLYFSEDEMLEFTPAFSDVYSDALLEAHEREVARLEALKEQRAPVLAVVDKHKTLIKDRDDLAASSQDASRLMMRGQKGEKRDPGKLLREEKMRKRIAKELPKVSAEVRKMLEKWEDEYGRPFLVFGERYLDELEVDGTRNTRPTSRSKTPAGLPPPSTVRASKSAGLLTRANSTKAAPPRAMNKTPTAACRTATKKLQSPGKINAAAQGRTSPSKIPARVPLSNLKNGSNSPGRTVRPESRAGAFRNGTLARAPPPKMRELKTVPHMQTPKIPLQNAGVDMSIVRHVEPEDVYDDRAPISRVTRSNSNLSNYAQAQYYEQAYENKYDDPYDDRYATIRVPRSGFSQALPPRQSSNTSSNSTAVSGSENWETYDDNSEPEPDVSEDYYARVRAARGKRFEPEHGHGATTNQMKRARGVPEALYAAAPIRIDGDENRIISGSEWTDEDVC
ncbi:Microtubule-associated protein, MAP65/ASE1-type [Moelleriella libera RCEF 2490]|uniref:Microtubule-associated protein, MAP65/ASE1-type n=1 Tax=Moelleriella libera RCEF 2490 TaxID=1081109 RepID=A0A166P1E7_9HYPO|nr:Microtubule-associated protein, MAP65/ASE1-type [Moelleriella libera RCEF 2490]